MWECVNFVWVGGWQSLGNKREDVGNEDLWLGDCERYGGKVERQGKMEKKIEKKKKMMKRK